MAAAKTSKSTTASTARKAAPAKPARRTNAPAKTAVTPDADRHAKAMATRAASAASDETMKCATCGEVKPIRKFPTTPRKADGTLGRGTTCRVCRDARWSAAKAASA